MMPDEPAPEGETIEASVRAVIAENPRQAQHFREGKTVLGFFVGQVMKRRQGRGDPTDVYGTLVRILAEVSPTNTA